jgi:hypothetical protein
LEDKVCLLLVEGEAFLIEMELVKFGKNKSPCYEVHVAVVRGSVGVGVTEEGVKSIPLRVSILFEVNPTVLFIAIHKN